jgi:hypothetical protein
VLIAVGLKVLLVAIVWPSFPAVTAVALIAMGATSALIARFRCSPSLPVIAGAHLFVYSSLYLLFVGAVFHSAVAKPGGGMSFLLCVDVALSILPMSAAVRIALGAIAGDGDVPAR